MCQENFKSPEQSSQLATSATGPQMDIILIRANNKDAVNKTIKTEKIILRIGLTLMDL